MKTQEIPTNAIDFHGEVLQLDQPAELTMYPEWNGDRPFTISDTAANLVDLAEAQYKATTLERGRTAVQAAMKPVKIAGQVLRPLAEGIGTEVKVMAFDVVYGTKVGAELHRQRRVRRITSFAGGLGILDIEPCAKHRKAMKQAESLL